jgi:quinolinate synthase
VVGSTSNILEFIERKVEAAAREGAADTRRLQFILGTEAGMVTSIVRSVQSILDAHADGNVEAEIVFPVSSEAVASADPDDAIAGLEIVPGVAGGEGCSTAGGCATCPFMKMNDLDAVQDIVDALALPGHELRLAKHLPPVGLKGKKIGGRDAIELGTEPIVYMREFMKKKRISDDLVEKVEATGGDQGNRIAA